MPKLSVIMGVYNGEPYLSEAIDSVLGQTFEAFEYILINDGSTDRSGQIIEDYARRDRRIVAVHQNNRGLVATLNRGISLAHSSLIARMDSDDVSLPDRFERQWRYLEANPHVAVVGGAVRIIDKNNRAVRDFHFPTASSDIRNGMKNDCMMAHSTVMARKAVVESLGGYRAAYQCAEDYDLWLRILEHHELANLPDIVLLYRRHGQRISARHSFQQAMAAATARMAHRHRLEKRFDPTSGIQGMLGYDHLTRICTNVEDHADALAILIKSKLSSLPMPAAKRESLPCLRCELRKVLRREGLGRSCRILLLSAAQVVRSLWYINSLHLPKRTDKRSPGVTGRMRGAIRRTRGHPRRSLRALRQWSALDEARKRFYGQFVRPGSLVFDVGANMGNRSKVLLALGARVVAIEPQSVCQAVLSAGLGGNVNFTLLPAALGAESGSGLMRVGEAHTLTSLSPEWIDAVSKSRRFGDHRWEQPVSVWLCTLDEIIERFGRPDFIKIDVEGFEAEVIRGLSEPISMISVEFTPESLSPMFMVLDYLESLGEVTCNAVVEETVQFAMTQWCPAGAMKDWLSACDVSIFGDVYIRMAV